MIDIRKLVEVDISFLGTKIILAEFTLGVLGSLALGFFILLRSHSIWQMILGWYILSMGVNYVPMLVYAIAMVRHRGARPELGVEPRHGTRPNFKYTIQSLVLLVPLLVPGMAIVQELHKAHTVKLQSQGS